MKANQVNYDNQEKSIQRSKTKKSKKGGRATFLLILLTLFLVSFSATSYIIINANKLTFNGEDAQVVKDEVDKLKADNKKKDATIEELTIQLQNAKSKSNSFSR